MELDEAITLAELEIARLEKDQDAQLLQLRETESQISRFSAMLDVLREAAELLALAADFKTRAESAIEKAQDEKAVADWSDLGRSAAVQRALRRFGSKGGGPAEIVDLLRRHGRNDDEYNLVSAALTHLARQGRAQQVERGRWVWVRPRKWNEEKPSGEDEPKNDESNDAVALAGGP